MILTTKQEEGLKIAVQRYKQGEKYTTIAGYAGTGKSTLVKFIIAALGLYNEDVAYVAYTGKAALVLKEKGCPNATTAHRLLYQSFPRKDGTFFHKPRRPLEYPYKLIVVDEVSMLPREMWNLLLSHRAYILALGDPGQLPPIGEDNGILANPHVFLDEIMRQAQESEIIRLSMSVREGRPLELYKGNEVQIIDKKELISGMFTWADQVLVAKNETRRNINQLMRGYIHGVGDTKPVEGDKVICLKNDWVNPNAMGDVMVNGSIGTIHNFQFDSSVHPLLQPGLILNFKPDYAETYNDNFNDLLVDYRLLLKGENTVNKNNFNIFKRIARPKELDYAYAITCHKSQGSEYDKVLVLEEWLKGGDHARWLYTAATRAKEKLVIVRDYK
jgi:exodeoxyribonuclease-5